LQLSVFSEEIRPGLPLGVVHRLALVDAVLGHVEALEPMGRNRVAHLEVGLAGQLPGQGCLVAPTLINPDPARDRQIRTPRVGQATLPLPGLLHEPKPGLEGLVPALGIDIDAAGDDDAAGD